MPANVTVLTGPARCGKTAVLLARYRERLAGAPPGSALWLAPTWRAVVEIRRRLLDAPMAGCLAPGVMTFEQFAESVLQASGVEKVSGTFSRNGPEGASQKRFLTPFPRLMKRHLVRALLERQHEDGRLAHFGPIAETGGLVDLADGWIGELKRLEIWPEHFRQACTARGMTGKDRELLSLYEAYQECLNRFQLYDAEGRFWSARTLLDEGQRRPFERLELVVADGFTDFTRTQHEILGILARRVEELLIALPLESDGRRADLFAKPAGTLDRLRGAHPELEVQSMPRQTKPPWAAMAHLEQELFGNPRDARPAQSVAGIEVVAASRELGEIEQVGARIKRLLVEGCPESGGRPVAPGDVAVVMRNPAGADALVREVFGRLGIPCWLESGRALERSMALRALVGLLQLDAEDWPFRRVLAVLTGSYFQPDWPEWASGRAAAAAERMVRRLQIPRGRQRLIERIQRMAEQPADAEAEPSEAVGRRAQEARLAWPLLERLGRALDRLPRRATLARWATAWRRLAEEFGLLRVVRQEPASQTALSDAAAWNRLLESLTVCSRLAEWMGESPSLSRLRERDAAQRQGEGGAAGEKDAPSPPAPLPQAGEGSDSSPPAPRPSPPSPAFADPLLDRREAIAALLDTMASVEIADSGDETACVRVLSAASVRALEVPYLFLAGLSEQAFPPPDREDRLYSESEAQRLIDQGLPLVARGERNREEMLLFYEAATRATRRLTLSYPALDERAGPLSPSPYLTEVLGACGPGLRVNEELELSPVPQSDEPLSAVDFRVKAVATALEGNAALLAGLVAGKGVRNLFPERPGGCFAEKVPDTFSGENILAGLRLAAQRHGREGFGPTEGMLAGAAVRRELAGLFDAERTFSATELERYAACPFRFYAESVLRLEPLEDLTLAIDYMTRGRLAHEALATLHAEINAACGHPASPTELPEGEYPRLLEETLRKVLERPVSHPVEAALREVDRRLLADWLSDYLRQHAEYDRQWKGFDRPPAPSHFEVSFGRSTSFTKGHAEKGVRNLFPERPEGCFAEKVPDTFSPLEITAAGRTIRLSGRIDRVDTGEIGGRVVFNVLDYKTGGSTRFSAAAVAAGTALQLPLYAMAVERLLLADQRAAGWMAGYWYLKQSGFKPRSAMRMHRCEDENLVEEPEWAEIRRVAAETAVALAEGIRRAEFPVSSADEHCTRHCPLGTICRIHQVRSLEKTWNPGPLDHEV